MTKFLNSAEGGTDGFGVVAGTPFYADEYVMHSPSLLGPLPEPIPWDGSTFFMERPDVSVPVLREHIAMDQAKAFYTFKVPGTLEETGDAQHECRVNFSTLPRYIKGISTIVGPDGVHSTMSVGADGSLIFERAHSVKVISEGKVELDRWCRLEAGPDYATVTVLPSGE